MSSGEIDALIAEWGEEDVRKAFWLQSHIKRNGLDGIQFSKKADGAVSSYGPMRTKQIIEGHLDDSYD